MMNPSKSATDKILTPRASAEEFGRNVATLIEHGNSMPSILETVAEYLTNVASAAQPLGDGWVEDQSISEANRYLYRWIAGE
jgi:hypothetical protein